MEATPLRRWSPAFATCPGTTADPPRFATCSPITAPRSPRRWRSGLGAGVSFYYVELDGPVALEVHERARRSLEEQFVELTGAPIRLETFDRPGASWERGAGAVDAGRPAILLTDLYYLDHYGSSAHFPGHAVVLAGYDAEVAYLSDTSFRGASDHAAREPPRARHGDHPAFPLEGHMFTASDSVRRRRAVARRRPGDRAKRASRCSTLRWANTRACLPFAVSPPRSATGPTGRGLALVRAIRYQVIERRGTGGGNFRLMYSRFLDEVATRARRPRGRGGAAAGRLGNAALQAASEPELPDPGHWSLVAQTAGDVLDVEERLWPAAGLPSCGLRQGSGAELGDSGASYALTRDPSDASTRSPLARPRLALGARADPDHGLGVERKPLAVDLDLADPPTARCRPPPGRPRRGRAPGTGARSPACRSPGCRTTRSPARPRTRLNAPP